MVIIMPYRILFVLFASLFLLENCAPYRAAWHSGWTQHDANNSMMLVIDQPPTLGYKRLQSHRAIHPEFAQLLEELGQPDCIAESTQEDQHYMILYYLNQRHAFSCRTNAKRSSAMMQFSGPYPISDKEFNTLTQFKAKALHSLENH
jgi:hypothetical protein